MNVPIDPRWKELVDELVGEGRYASADEVVSEGLRLVEERENKRKALRDHLNAAVERGGSHTDEEVIASVERALDDWEASRRKRA
ncbi:type II toxin-antitoxin system ParD family antitoxin [Chelatococcus sambhunathii]|uniref:Type II toxin-antitoxin system ParD family antitoxin n=1 Tax=Chelatococcus sambhunathii TaxID=363953 RepID=A0ABU1DHF7_9HYPH|nr:type II toxin-antitoxin system ParD family antitoxin [Chelatococcus sambhunathii]MDR4307546.1 type II toxin-antitoxin system ParD family antitoxin [Chelatococcus sambhunathii]